MFQRVGAEKASPLVKKLFFEWDSDRSGTLNQPKLLEAASALELRWTAADIEAVLLTAGAARTLQVVHKLTEDSRPIAFR